MPFVAYIDRQQIKRTPVTFFAHLYQQSILLSIKTQIEQFKIDWKDDAFESKIVGHYSFPL